MRKNIDMLNDRLGPSIIRYTIPIILTSLLQLLFNAADLVIVGQFGDSKSNAVAAVGCTSAITALMTNFFIGCSAGSEKEAFDRYIKSHKGEPLIMY